MYRPCLLNTDSVRGLSYCESFSCSTALSLQDCSLEYLLTGEETKKEPVPGISENGREMLALYERLPERQQILLIGRLQEMVEPLASPNEKDIAIASDGEAI